MSLSQSSSAVDVYIMIDETHLAWFAGLFEGEGSIFLSKPSKRGGTYLRMSIGMTDQDVLLKVQNLLGGQLRGPLASKTPLNRPGKPMYYWTLTRTEDVREVATRILPWLGRRRAQKVATVLQVQQYAANPTAEDLFWSHVDKGEECWEWTAHIDRFGFGTAWLPAEGRYQAHRRSHELVTGQVPPKRMKNLCGSKSCVNPAHWRADGKIYTQAADES